MCVRRCTDALHCTVQFYMYLLRSFARFLSFCLVHVCSIRYGSGLQQQQHQQQPLRNTRNINLTLVDRNTRAHFAGLCALALCLGDSFLCVCTFVFIYAGNAEVRQRR